jgi:hypothetical protein
MEPEGSLPHLQKPATGPYPETDECSQFSSIYLNEHYAMKAYWEWRYSSTHSWPQH